MRQSFDSAEPATSPICRRSLSSPDAPPVQALRIRDPRYGLREKDSKDQMIYITFGSEAAAMPFFTEVVQAAIDAVGGLGGKLSWP